MIASSYGLKLQRLPIIGIDLDKPPSINVVLFFLYAFFSYFLLAWVARYLSERAEQLLPMEKLDAFGNRMNEMLSRLEKQYPPDSSIIPEIAAEKANAFNSIRSE